MNANDSKIQISTAFCLLWIPALLIFPVKWIAAWWIAALVHESFHLIALKLLRKNLYKVEIGLLGAKLICEPLQPKEDLLVSLAGPFGGVLVIFTFSVWPHLAMCAFWQTAYNTAPIPPLDGGRAVGIVLRYFLPPSKAKRLEQRIQLLWILCLFCLGIYQILRGQKHFGILLLAFSFRIRSSSINIACKPNYKGVQ